MDANIIIGKPLVKPEELYTDEIIHLHTEERFLPNILVKIGIFKSVNEVRKNRSDLFKELNDLDFIHLKIGKHHIWIVVGE